METILYVLPPVSGLVGMGVVVGGMVVVLIGHLENLGGAYGQLGRRAAVGGLTFLRK